MKLTIALVLVTAHSAVLADQENNRSFPPPPSCKVKFKKGLTAYSKYFNRFLWTADCMRINYFDELEAPKPYDGELPSVSSVDIDTIANIAVYFPQIEGPESIAVDETRDVAYTGSSDGYIYKIYLNNMTATKLATACDVEGVESCRPLGIRHTSENKLYFADNAGLCEYDFETGNVTVLVPLLSEVDNEPIMLLNDLDVHEKDQMIYMSDGSTRYPNSKILRGLLLHETSGRVLAYNITDKTVSVLVKNLSFPNGIQMSHDKKTVLVNEMSKRRILQVQLKGSRKGKYKVFTPELPGEPDNIRLASGGKYWVAINLARDGKDMTLYDYLSNSSCLTTRFMKMNGLIADYMRFLGILTQRPEYTDISDRLESYQFISEMASHEGSLVLIGRNGRIVKRYMTDEVGFFSTAVEYKNLLLVGNDRHPNIAIIDGIIQSLARNKTKN